LCRDSLGKDNITFLATFSDGAAAKLTVQVEVVPPNSLAESLSVSEGQIGARKFVSLAASYAGETQKIHIAPRYITYEVRDLKNSPSIRVDPATGLIAPLENGHSLLSMSFDGKTALTCVVVNNVHQDVPDRSDCEDLLRPGENLTSRISDTTTREAK
jgi:hypothetical protein